MLSMLVRHKLLVANPGQTADVGRAKPARAARGDPRGDLETNSAQTLRARLPLGGQ